MKIILLLPVEGEVLRSILLELYDGCVPTKVLGSWNPVIRTEHQHHLN
jgi:hypothetical protein